MPPSPVCVIVNPAAGGGRAGRALAFVLEALREHGLQARSEQTRDLAHAGELARTAARQGEIVACLSGDGMVGAVADALRGVPGSLIAVLPGGRGNDLARVLGIPRDPVKACETLATGVPRRIDLGEVGGKAFVGIASVGMDSNANRIANAGPAWLAGMGYAYGALRALAGWRDARFTVRLEPDGPAGGGPAGPVLRFAGYTVAAANSKSYGGGMLLAPHAALDDGLLDIVTVGAMPKPWLLVNLPRVFRGGHLKLKAIEVHRAAEVEISADRPFTLYADGDPVGQLPLRVKALPGAVRVLVPKGSG